MAEQQVDSDSLTYCGAEYGEARQGECECCSCSASSQPPDPTRPPLANQAGASGGRHGGEPATTVSDAARSDHAIRPAEPLTRPVAEGGA